MLKHRGCPRCKGNLLVDRDHHGWYEQCLQCGYQRNLESMLMAPKQAKTDSKVVKNT